MNIRRAPRLWAPLGARRGKVGFRENRGLKPPRERPRGAAAPIVTGVWGLQSPSYIF